MQVWVTCSILLTLLHHFARFVHTAVLVTCFNHCIVQVLYDLGVVSTKEPFGRLVSQGMILGEVEYSYCVDAEGKTCSEDKHDAVTIRVGWCDGGFGVWEGALHVGEFVGTI